MTPLVGMVDEELARPVPEGARVLADQLRGRFGANLRAVLMYGSNLRRGDDAEGVLDLYVLVARYRSAYRNPLLSLANRMLPPNVFYLEVPVRGRVVRCKYAVLALDDLPRLTSAATTEPYFWARFAQPCALVWSAGPEERDAVGRALAGAVVTFVRFGVALGPATFDARTLWTTTWQATYAAEIRPERASATEDLFGRDAGRFERATTLALPLLPWPAERAGTTGRFRVDVPAPERRRAAFAWALHRRQAKGKFLLRILRNALIFEGGVDYVLWKIQRHSGVAIDQAWRRKRYPWLALGAEAWRLYRARAFR